MKMKINTNILWFVGAFFIISLLAITGASMYTSKDLGNLVLKQATWYIIGGFVIFLVYKVGNRFLYDMTWWLYGIGLLSLILLLILGHLLIIVNVGLLFLVLEVCSLVSL